MLGFALLRAAVLLRCRYFTQNHRARNQGSVQRPHANPAMSPRFVRMTKDCPNIVNSVGPSDENKTKDFASATRAPHCRPASRYWANISPRVIPTQHRKRLSESPPTPKLLRLLESLFVPSATGKGTQKTAFTGNPKSTQTRASPNCGPRLPASARRGDPRE